jgi:outer membrane biosynthesis protein TonB
MRTSMAYFAGAGTVVIAIAAGLGGGLTIANIVSPHASNQEMTKLEQRRQADRALDPVKDTNQPSQPMSYLAATQPASGSTVAQPPMQNPPPSLTPSQTEANNPAPQPAQPAAQSETTAANNAAAKPAEATPPKPSTSTVQGNSDQQASTSQDAMAKARDADLKRLAEKRRLERRQQWADRRRYRDQQREQELRDVEQSVREDTEPRYTEPRYFVGEPARAASPQIRLFGPD